MQLFFFSFWIHISPFSTILLVLTITTKREHAKTTSPLPPSENAVDVGPWISHQVHSGAGNIALFWHCKWMGEFPLKLSFPGLFNCCTKPKGLIRDMESMSANGWVWDLHLLADAVLAHPQVAVEALDLFEILLTVNVNSEVGDSFKWWPSKDGYFSVKSCYKNLREKDLEVALPSNTNGILQQLWKSRIPSNIKIFGWRVMISRLATRDQLAKRGIIHDEEDKVCVLCGYHSKTWNIYSSNVSLH